MKRKYFILSALLISMLACGKSTKQSLSKEDSKEKAIILSKDSLQQSLVVYNAAQAILLSNKATPKVGKRVINSNSPPIKLNLWETDLKIKEFDLADYYSKVNYVILQHPFKMQQGTFFGNTTIRIHFGSGGYATEYNMNSEIFLTDQQIVAGDTFGGYHVYNQSGVFLYTLAMPDKLPTFVKRDNYATLHTQGMKGNIYNFSIWKNRALIVAKEDSICKIHIYDLEKSKGESSLIISDQTHYTNLINRNEYIDYTLFSDFNEKYPLWTILNGKDGVMVSEFYDYNSKIESGDKIFTYPEYNLTYYKNDTLMVRQAFNDTIYRIKSSQEMEAAYIFQMGDKKLSVRDAVTANTKSKLIFNSCLETDDFMYLCFSLDRDFPNNRKTGGVKFQYYCYDKKDKKLYVIKSLAYPEDFILHNSINTALPLKAKRAKTINKQLYSSYTKGQLKAMIEAKCFLTLSMLQQKKAIELYESMGDSELVVVIME